MGGRLPDVVYSGCERCTQCLGSISNGGNIFIARNWKTLKSQWEGVARQVTKSGVEEKLPSEIRAVSLVQTSPGSCGLLWWAE